LGQAEKKSGTHKLVGDSSIIPVIADPANPLAPNQHTSPFVGDLVWPKSGRGLPGRTAPIDAACEFFPIALTPNGNPFLVHSRPGSTEARIPALIPYLGPRLGNVALWEESAGNRGVDLGRQAGARTKKTKRQQQNLPD